MKEAPVDYVEILSRVDQGDGREDALAALSDAWYHSECVFPSGAVEDLFLYGPKDRDRVVIVSVVSGPQDSSLVVEQTGTFESYFLDAPDFGSLCDPPLLDAFE